MPALIGIAGSLRSGSYNASLLRAAAQLAPDGVELEIGAIADIPLYNADVEAASGVPEPVVRLRESIARADGLLLATPEYNGSIPGVMKNALDWLSRPPKDTARVFRGLPVGLMGASPGGGGTRMAQTAWLPVLRSLGTQPWFAGRLHVGGARQLFDEHGRLTDQALRASVTEYMAGFAGFVAANPRA